MQNNENFDIESFISPDEIHAPVYVWVWNDICTKEIIDAQLQEMRNLGIRAFYILAEPKDFRPDSMPTNLTPDYLSEEYFELCEYAVEKGKEYGMLCWIYDEGGWPSGSACGKVLKAHPEYARQTLEIYDRFFGAGDVCFAAEVLLNDRPLGCALMPPYRIKIPAGVLDENNKLKIVVTNTAANWYVHTDYFDNRNINELSPYFEAETEYAKDFVSGGLYGPVVLYTE